MAIRVKYFASLRDQLGRAGDELSAGADDALTATEVWRRLWPETPLPANALIAINQEYGEPDQPIRDGDEVAFFPPVTGG